ncbi:alpha-ribazole kinase [Desulfosporosinus acidiphilus]|uniref:alpha-ribazole kinase n=1 Tax=Desulfosporosinus acidiphilus TaxID=885581 RepID=UPI00059D0CB7|nr:alpha-ribazole kinase [Desulfosporosinus acidiphilus]
MGYQGRDIEAVLINPEQYLIASCDSCGAIGLKEFDVVKVSWSVTGRMTTRVALLEVLAVGAVPKIMTVAISNEPSPTGEELLKGVKEELDFAGLNLSMAVSTEKNIPTQQTGLGISVIGTVRTEHLRVGTSQIGDEVYCLGMPKVGSELCNPEDPEIVQVTDLQKLLEVLGIHDVIPVGSKGILKEAQLLASNNNSKLLINQSCSLDLNKSAGPSTCLVFSASSSTKENLLSLNRDQLQLNKIGALI